MYYSKLIGTGIGLPQKIMYNHEFEKFVDTSDEWIRERTGIETRYIIDSNKGESTLSLTKLAAEQALLKASCNAKDIDLIIVGTVTPENIMPTTANQLQSYLGAKNAFTFDLQAACSGFIYGFSIADHFIRAGSINKALIVGVETLSTLIDWRDRATCVLFGDAAGAVIIEKTESQDHAVLGTVLHSDGDYYDLLNIPHGFAKIPPYSPNYLHTMHKIKMQGSEVFKIAVKSMVNASKELLEKCSISINDVNFFLFHQANQRIIHSCLKALNVSPEKTWINVNKYGNTSAATLPICLHEAWEAGKIKSGDLILMATFGGGLTWGSALVRL